MEIELPKSETHLARIVSERIIKEIIYQLEICNPHNCAYWAHLLKEALRK